MSELIFNRVKHENHNSVSVYIKDTFLTLKENYECIKIEKTKWGNSKAVIQ